MARLISLRPALQLSASHVTNRSLRSRAFHIQLNQLHDLWQGGRPGGDAAHTIDVPQPLGLPAGLPAPGPVRCPLPVSRCSAAHGRVLLPLDGPRRLPLLELSGRRARARARAISPAAPRTVSLAALFLTVCALPHAVRPTRPSFPLLLPPAVDCLRWILRAPAGRWSPCASTPRVRAPAYLPSMLAFARSLGVIFASVKAGASTRRSQAPAPSHEGTTRAALRFHARRGDVSMYL